MEYPEPYKSPYDGLEPLAEGTVYHQVYPHPNFLSDPAWYDTLGGTLLQQRDVFNPKKTGAEQVNLVKEILKKTPTDTEDHDRSYDIIEDAAAFGSEAVVRHLLTHKSVKLTEDRPAWTWNILPLHAAAWRGHLAVVKTLVEVGGMRVDTKDTVQNTPLMRAAFGGNVAVVRWLLERGANPKAVDFDGPPCSPIDYGARGGSAEVVQMLVDALKIKRARANRATKQHVEEQWITNDTLKYAAQSGSAEVVSTILEHGGFLENKEAGTDNHRAICTAITFAAKTFHGTVPAMKRLVDCVLPQDEAGRYVRSEDTNFAFALVEAAKLASYRGLPDVLRFALGTLRDHSSAPVAAPGPLHYLVSDACLGRCHELRTIGAARVLLEDFGADVNWHCVDNTNITALDGAVRLGSGVEMVRFYLEHGADTQRGRGKYANGPTPLYIAVLAQNKVDVVRELLEWGGPVESIEDGLEGATEVQVVAERAYRAPVRLRRKVTQNGEGDEPRENEGGEEEKKRQENSTEGKKEAGNDEIPEIGEDDNEDGEGWEDEDDEVEEEVEDGSDNGDDEEEDEDEDNDEHVATLKFENGVTKDWLEKLQIRKRDHDLAMDLTMRPLMSPGDEVDEEAGFDVPYTLG